MGAIALSMSPNENGYFTFMSLDTGKKINRRKFTELPITETVIKRVEFLAEEECQPKIKNGCPLFEWEIGMTIDDDENQDDYDSDYEYENDDDNVYDEDDYEDEREAPTYEPEVDPQEVEVNEMVNSEEDTTNVEAENRNEIDDVESRGEAMEAENEANNHSSENEEINALEDNDEEDVANATAARTATVDEGEGAKQRSAEERSTEERSGEQRSGEQRSGEQRSDERRSASHLHNLRTNRARSYNHLFPKEAHEINFLQAATTVSYILEKHESSNENKESDKFGMQFLQHSVEHVEESPGKFYEYVCHHMFNQMPAKKGIEKHG